MINWIKHFLFTPSPSRKRNDIETRFNTLIENFCETCGDNPSINRPKLLKWIEQFNSNSYSIPEKVLKELRYYSSSNLSRMTAELVEIVYNEFKCQKKDLFFVPIGDDGSGSQIIARSLRNNEKVIASNVINIHKLHLTKSEEAKNKIIVFLDDFSGTGDTFETWWLMNEPLIYPFNAKLGIALAVLNQKAEIKIRSYIPHTFYIDYLSDRHNVFNETSEIFDQKEKTKLLEYCSHTGCGQNYIKGYGECGLMISFQHGCPNNSIPILWYNRNKWLNLFNRRN